MKSFDKAYSSSYLKEVHKAVKRCYPTINLRKAAWVYGYGREQWEFQITHGYPGLNAFMYSTRACSAFEARAKGWEAYLHEYQPEFYAEWQKEAESD